MIVTCEQCHTRFKIPDDKVSEKGVKVRCTKCGNTFRVSRDLGPTGGGAVPIPVPAAPAPDVDPFAKFGSSADLTHGDPTRPGVFALGVEMTRMPERPRSAPLAAPSFDFSTLVPPRPAAVPAPAPFDFSALSAPPPPAPLPVPATSPARAPSGAFPFAPAPPPAAPAAFDFSTLTAPPPPPPPAPVAVPHRSAPPAAASTPAFDFSSLGPPPGFVEAGPQGFDPLGAAPPPPPAPSRSPTRPPSSAPPAPPPSAPRDPPRANTDEFFGAPLPAAIPEPVKQLLDLPDESSPDDVKSALFDMPAPPPPAASTAATELVPAFAPAAPAPVPTFSSTSLPAVRDPGARRRTALGVVVNLVIAAVLVAALLVLGSALLNDGKLSRDTLSLEALKANLMPTTDFVTSDISNGLYATRAGRSVFFVRGEVLNASASATRISVQADIVEGAHVVRSAKGLAGAVPTAEELYALAAADDLEKLTERIQGRAVVVEPGASMPFLVTFTEYPPDLKAFRVRVVSRAEGAGTTAQRP